MIHCISMMLLWQWYITEEVLCHAAQKLCSIIFFLTHRTQNSDNWFVYTSNFSPPGMFLPLDLLLKYWTEHVIIGILYVKSIVSTRIYYKGVTGLATDNPCGVWCCRLTTCLLYVDPLFETSFKRQLLCNNFFSSFQFSLWIYLQIS